MRHRVLDLLACPKCGGFPLELTVLETESDPPPGVSGVRCSAWCAWQKEAPAGKARPCSECYAVEITQAILHCKGCAAEYPVIDGIPRFIPDVDQDYPEFFRRYADRFRHAKPVDAHDFHKLHSETRQSFGFQWLRFKVTDHAENQAHFFRRLDITPADTKGKIFFEAGCGMGRYLKVIGDEPTAEAVGLDLSLAVNRARAENRQNPFIHVIQGNIMELPLRAETIDYVYSIGVLHHTPDTRQAFQSIVRLAKPGGRVSIWVYHVWRHSGVRGLQALHATLKGRITDGVRAITTRLPFRVLNALCYVAVPGGWLQRKITDSPAPIRALFSPLTLLNLSMHDRWEVRVLDTFDWYSPRYQWKHTVPEVEGWFRDAGLADITTHGYPVSVRGRRTMAAETRQTKPASKARAPR